MSEAQALVNLAARCFKSRGPVLHVGGASVAELANRYGTPVSRSHPEVSSCRRLLPAVLQNGSFSPVRVKQTVSSTSRSAATLAKSMSNQPVKQSALLHSADSPAAGHE